MTIYTPSVADKKPEKDADDIPEVVTEPLTGTKDKDEEAVVYPPKELRVHCDYYRAKRRRACILMLSSSILLLLLSLGIFLTYKHYNKRVDQKYMRATCGTQFYDELYHGVEIDDADPIQDDYMEEDIVVSATERYEEFKTPEFDEVRETFVMHDFAMNYTAIVDHKMERCFVTGIRKNILRPSDLIIQIRDSSGSTLVMKTVVIREDYMMVAPSSLNRHPFGKRIAEKCASYQVYWLEMFVNGVFKRSADLPVATYAELTNNPYSPVLYKMRIHEKRHTQ